MATPRQERWWAKNRERVNREKRERSASDPEYRTQKLRDAQERRSRNRAIVNAYKLEKGCARCGFKAHPAAMDLHHRDGDSKEFGISGRIASVEKLVVEMKKCEVLCANCHRIHHAEE